MTVAQMSGGRKTAREKEKQLREASPARATADIALTIIPNVKKIVVLLMRMRVRVRMFLLMLVNDGDCDSDSEK